MSRSSSDDHWSVLPHVSFNRHRFVARLLQWHCEKRRFWIPGCFGGTKTGRGTRHRGGKTRQTWETRAKTVRNPRSVCAPVFDRGRAQIPRFEKSKRGKFERDFFARGWERGFRMARDAVIDCGCARKRVSRHWTARRAQRGEVRGVAPSRSRRACGCARETSSDRARTSGRASSGTRCHKEGLRGMSITFACLPPERCKHGTLRR
jgi:hypothetical protein